MKKLFVIILAVLALLPSHRAHAHVLITDDTGQRGAVLHINPDDSPIAGQPSVIFLDMQNATLDENTSASLTVTSVDQQAETGGIIDESLATFVHTFPTQGVYELAFTATTDNTKYTYTMSWRVSRGNATSSLDTPRYAWAEITLLISGVGAALLITLVLSKWRSIQKQSTF